MWNKGWVKFVCKISDLELALNQCAILIYNSDIIVKFGDEYFILHDYDFYRKVGPDTMMGGMRENIDEETYKLYQTFS